MNTNRSGASLQQFAEEIRSFLAQNTNRKASHETSFEWGVGPDELSLWEEVDRETELARVSLAQLWRSKRFDAGLGYITGPADFGGRELTPAHERLYNEMEAEYDVPSSSCLVIGLGMVAPTILAHGNAGLKERYLRALWRGDIIGAQLFSEPRAGSDLANVHTRAERDGDEWVINGQKVWTSGAHYADIGLVICRTDPDRPKHRGLTAFIIDMRLPGITVRPLRQMTGGASFNEVFLDDVRIKDESRLGAVNDGWSVALTTLSNERATIGGGAGGTSAIGDTARLIAMLRQHGLQGSAVLRQDLARIYSGFRIASWTSQRATEKLTAGLPPGPELSAHKLAVTANLRAVSEFVAKVLGPRLVADSGEWGTYSWRQLVCGVPGMRLAGGSDEIQRKIISERVLGLAKELTVSEIAFKDSVR